MEINEEYFLWLSSNILRLLSKIISQKRCAEPLQIIARSKYSICRCLLFVWFFTSGIFVMCWCHSSNVLLWSPWFQTQQHSRISHCLLLVERWCSHPRYQLGCAVHGAEASLLHPEGVVRFLKSIFMLWEQGGVGQHLLSDFFFFHWQTSLLTKWNFFFFFWVSAFWQNHFLIRID